MTKLADTVLVRFFHRVIDAFIAIRRRPVLTFAFPFRSVPRFPDGIATTKPQAKSIYFIRQSENQDRRRCKHEHASGNLPTLMETTITVILL
ncbi:hypothetical protein T02_12488 [Trichinella nativa]|uniref:Uncharacterized protein n=1 Tax=Trichinella nativa TaxID=6335 RepID=A0A0V1KN90_9BILA|nr:hypothetical protein T02_12488 [Trichinella nativa]